MTIVPHSNWRKDLTEGGGFIQVGNQRVTIGQPQRPLVQSRSTQRQTTPLPRPSATQQQQMLQRYNQQRRQQSSTPRTTTQTSTTSTTRAASPRPAASSGSTSGYGNVGSIGNVGGNLRFIKDRSAERNRILQQLRQNYQPERDMVENYQYSNWRDDFKPVEYEFTDLIKPEPIKVIEEGKKKGLWDNIHAKRKRGEKPAKPGEKGYPETLDVEEGAIPDAIDPKAHRKQQRAAKIRTLAKKGSTEGERAAAEKKTKGPKMFGEEESKIGGGNLKKLATKATKRIDTDVDGDVDSKDMKSGETGEFVPGPDGKKVKPKVRFEHSDWRLEFDEGAAWTKKSGKSESGGLNEKGRKSYERENPGSDLKAPSKKVGNPRRKSFCARMKGMKKKLTSAKTASDPDSRINKSLRAWNC